MIKKPVLGCVILILLISDKPYFRPESLGRYTVVEGEAKNISLRAMGNPPQIDYSWTFPPGVQSSGSGGEDRVVQRGHLLTLRDAWRTDSGEYTVTARNSYGDFATTVTVELDVRYPPA